jgi:hypothetical protein
LIKTAWVRCGDTSKCNPGESEEVIEDIPGFVRNSIIILADSIRIRRPDLRYRMQRNVSANTFFVIIIRDAAADGSFPFTAVL